MKIVVCAKQVPNTTDIKINQETGTLVRDGVESILNHDDANALEQALQLKDMFPESKVIVLSMGPQQAIEMLQECIAMGADEAILLSDKILGGSDTWATSNALAAAINKIGDVDIVFAGRQAIDGDTAQVGPQIAEKLDLPQVTYVKEFSIEDETVIVKRALEDGYETLKLHTPCMLTTIKELNIPRYMTVKGIMRSVDTDITKWTAEDIKVDKDIVGLKASPTNVYKSFTPKPKGKGIDIVGDSPKEMVKNLMGELKSKHII